MLCWNNTRTKSNSWKSFWPNFKRAEICLKMVNLALLKLHSKSIRLSRLRWSKITSKIIVTKFWDNSKIRRISTRKRRLKKQEKIKTCQTRSFPFKVLPKSKQQAQKQALTDLLTRSCWKSWMRRKRKKIKFKVNWRRKRKRWVKNRPRRRNWKSIWANLKPNWSTVVTSFKRKNVSRLKSTVNCKNNWKVSVKRRKNWESKSCKKRKRFCWCNKRTRIWKVKLKRSEA